ncbi:MAG: hypothetical protein DMF10_11265 [Verrucomicrobia bacterium]|nr:MAG: hypothetical protein DMF10_11265 [Verrucomicrobiota bacterium]
MTNSLILFQKSVVLAMANPLTGPDHEVAGWFHAHLTRTFVSVLRAFTEFGSGEWIGVVLFFVALYFMWKKWWPSLVTLIIAVPGGMLLNEWVKILVHRHRPFVDGPYVDWSGYSFASGHTIGATLLYGQLLLFVLPALKTRHLRLLSIFSGIVWLMLCMVLRKPIRRRNLQPEIIIPLASPGEALLAPVVAETHRGPTLEA